MRRLRKTVLKSVLSIILTIAMVLGAVPLDGIVLVAKAADSDYQYKLTFYYKDFSADNQKYKKTNKSTIELSEVIYSLDNRTGIPYESDMFVKGNTAIAVSDSSILTVTEYSDEGNISSM